MTIAREEKEEDEADREPCFIDVAMLQQKVRASKRILIFLCIGFSAFCSVTGEDLRKLFLILALAAGYHLAFHVWCDCADPALLLSRHKIHVYLVMLTDLLLMTVAVPRKTIFTRALAVLVMPLSFTREVGETKHAAIFLVMHAALTIYLLREDLVDEGTFGEGMQWLACLAIVDAMVLDASATRLKAAELGSLLHVAYKSSEEVSRVTVKHLLRNLCESFVVIDVNSKLTEDSATLAEMLGWGCNNDGMSFENFVHYDDREEFRNHMAMWHGQGTDAGANEESITTTSLKIQLLDSYGLGMPSLLFFAKLWGIDGEFVYYVGTCHAWQMKSPSKSKRSSKGRWHSRLQPDAHAGWQTGSLAQQLASDLPKENQPDPIFGCHMGLQGSVLGDTGTESSVAACDGGLPRPRDRRVTARSSSPAYLTAERLACRKTARSLPPESM